MIKSKSEIPDIKKLLKQVKKLELEGDFKKALEICEQANSAFPKYPNVRSKLARLKNKIAIVAPEINLKSTVDKKKDYINISTEATTFTDKLTWNENDEGNYLASFKGYDLCFNQKTGDITISVVDYHSGALLLNLSDFPVLRRKG